MITPEQLIEEELVVSLKEMMQEGHHDILKEYCKNLKNKITADDLLNLNRHIYKIPDQQFYFDLAEYVTNDIRKKPNFYANTYIEFFKKQYLSTYNEALEISEDDVITYFDKYKDDLIGNNVLYSRDKYRFFCFLFRFKDNKKLIDYCKDFSFEDKKRPISDRDYHRFAVIALLETEKNYKEYIKCCRKLLAKSLNISENKLNDKIYKSMLNGIDREMCNFTKGPFYSFIQALIANENGSCIWLDASLVDFKDDKSFKKIRYYPDINLIIESFYQSRLLNFHVAITRVSDNVNIPLEYARHLFIEQNTTDEDTRTKLEESDPQAWAKLIVYESNYDEICNIAYSDVLYHLFRYVLKSLYEEKLKNFFTEEKIVQADSEKIEKLTAAMKQLQKEKESLLAQNYQLNTQLNKKKAELNKFHNELDMYVSEVNEEYQEYAESVKEELGYYPYEIEQEPIVDSSVILKEQIKERDQLIQALLSADVESDTEEVAEMDLAQLHMNRYLFVGDLSVIGLGDLKFHFPKSVYMETETTNITNLKVDYIVLLTKAMGHSMFYKVQSTSNLNGIPRIYYNGKNLNNLLNTMHQMICNQYK